VRLNVLNVDLNLLVAFDALITEGNVTRAAARICVSQPAMSRSLKQLRAIFNDELFQRTHTGMIPTPRAVQMSRLIRPALQSIADAIGMKEAFDPTTVKRRFVIAMPDVAAHLAMPDIVRRVQRLAPGIDIAIINAGNRDAITKVETGQAEFALGVYDHLPIGIVSSNLRPLKEVCIADRGNALLIDGILDIDRFLALPHVSTAVNDDHGIPIDTVLETLGMKRRIALSVPHFVSIPRLVLGTSMIGVVTEELLHGATERDLLRAFPIPLPMPAVMAKIIWHQRDKNDRGHQWLLKQILASAKRDQRSVF
jgi:LysR family transcriptional regulator, mexEF-oprN operon transcriptional activator